LGDVSQYLYNNLNLRAFLIRAEIPSA